MRCKEGCTPYTYYYYYYYYYYYLAFLYTSKNDPSPSTAEDFNT